MRRKIRKFADRQRTNRQSSRQTDSSNTEATLILCGSSGERANKAWDEAEKQGEVFTVEDCRSIAHAHWESVRHNQITLSRTQGQNGLVVNKDGTKTKRKRKKAKKASPDAKVEG